MTNPTMWYGQCRVVSHTQNWFLIYGVHILISRRDLRRGTSWFHQLLGLSHSHYGYGIQGFGWLIGHSALW